MSYDDGALRLVDEARRNALLYRIIDGKLKYRGRYILEPSLDIKRRAKNIYYKSLLEIDPSSVLDDRTLLIRLYDEYDWSEEKEKFINTAPKNLENLKLKYFNNFHTPGVKKQLKTEIEQTLEKYCELISIRKSFDQYTAKGIARGSEARFIISKTYKGKDKLGALKYKLQNQISESDLRAICLSEEWNSYFNISKNPFGTKTINLTDDQRALLSWSNAYKNIRNHPDCPIDSIIKDDFALDGWMINESRKSNAEKSKKVNIGKVKDNARAVYLMTNSEDERRDILSLNDAKALSKVEKDLKL